MLTVAIDQVVKVSVNEVIGEWGWGGFARSSTWLEPLSGTSSAIVDAYMAESDAARKERLRKSYFEITGRHRYYCGLSKTPGTWINFNFSTNKPQWKTRGP
jgi:hypothetical protein